MMEAQFTSLAIRAASLGARVEVLCASNSRAHYVEMKHVHLTDLNAAMRAYAQVTCTAQPAQTVIVTIELEGKKSMSRVAEAIGTALDHYQALGFPRAILRSGRKKSGHDGSSEGRAASRASV